MFERAALAAALGVLLGAIGATALFLQWLTLIPWGLAALFVGAVCRDRREAIVSGGVYGFLLGFTFIALGYRGSDPILSKVWFFAILGLVSAGFGIIISVVGYWVAERSRRRPTQSG